MLEIGTALSASEGQALEEIPKAIAALREMLLAQSVALRAELGSIREELRHQRQAAKEAGE